MPVFIDFHRFPKELQCEIFLIAAANHARPHRYLLVAHRFRVWVERTVYHSVILHTNAAAQLFIISIEHRPEFALAAVRKLYMAMTIRNDYAAQILDTCKGVTDLTLRVICHHLLAKNPIIDPLEALPLTLLSADLSAIFHDQYSYLPNLQVAHRITHLHLTNAWVSWAGIPVGLVRLKQLTHLSIPWCTTRSDSNLVRELLESTNLKVLVLWSSEYEKCEEVVKCLSKEGLEDRRIISLNSKLYSHYLIFGGFWDYADRLIKWQEEEEANFPFEIPDNMTLRKK